MMYWKNDSNVYHTNPPGKCSKNHYDEDDLNWNKDTTKPATKWDYCNECKKIDKKD